MGIPWNPNLIMDTEEKTSPYLRRREAYEKVPWLAAPFLYSFADVQKDRIEVMTVAFGTAYEMWGVHLAVFYGETQMLEGKNLPPVWQQLEEYRHKTWEHESGESCRIVRMFIDAGYIQSMVLKFCRGKRPQVWPSKGMSDKDVRAPFVSRRPKADKANKMLYYPIGVNEGKELIFSNFGKELPEIKEGELPPSVPGLMHFNNYFDVEFFKQLLVSERPVWKGRIQVFEKISAAARNEGLDMTVGVRACYESAGIDSKPYVEAMRKKWEKQQKADREATEGRQEVDENRQEQQRRPAPRRGNFVTGWKR
jgi:phage terminase large subunit GpA-like protein